MNLLRFSIYYVFSFFFVVLYYVEVVLYCFPISRFDGLLMLHRCIKVLYSGLSSTILFC